MEKSREVMLGTALSDDEASEELLEPHPQRRKLYWSAALLASGLLLALCFLGQKHLLPSSFDVEELWSNEGKCAGMLRLKNFADYHLITARMNKPDDPASRDLTGDFDSVRLGMKSRAYLGDTCNAGGFNQNEYMKVNLINKRFSFKVDLKGAGCGCNAALYLVSMKYSWEKGQCDDYYCDAVSVCGLKCAEIDLMEANERAFHTTLHNGVSAWDPKVGCGGGGTTMAGKEWLGPRDWSPEEYGPGAKCIDTRQPFQASYDFESHANEWKLKSINVILTQNGCKLTAKTEEYHEMMPALTKRLNEGMTIVLSYWSDPGMTWLDGEGYDGVKFCKAKAEKDSVRKCAEHVSFSDFEVTKLDTYIGDE